MVSKNPLPSMIERIKTCRFCGNELRVSSLSFQENPFCNGCLSERLAAAAKENQFLSWTVNGDYMESIDLSQQKPQ